MAGLAEAVSRLSHIMRRLLSQGSAVSADIWIDVAETLQGTLLLAVAPTRRRVGRFYAMDFAQGSICQDVTSRLLDAMVSRQQVGVSSSERVPYTVRGFFGLQSASEANAFLQRLRAAIFRSTTRERHLDWSAFFCAR